MYIVLLVQQLMNQLNTSRHLASQTYSVASFMINLAKANLEPMLNLTKMKTFCSTYLLYQSTTLLLPIFMLQVIYQVSMACAVNEFNPPLPGTVQDLTMTVFLWLKSKTRLDFVA